MIRLLLPLLLSGATAVPLAEQFECGPQALEIIKSVARETVDRCIAPVVDGTNLCCKAHDLCFDLHSITGYTRDICDAHFCNCLQDLSDRTKNYDCSNALDSFCMTARYLGDLPFQSAVPDTHAGLSIVDQKPFGLDMQSLVDTCQYSKVVAIHCHDTANKCLAKPHIPFRGKRLEAAEEQRHFEPYQDCHSSMHYCLRMIEDYETNEQCVVLAKSFSKKIRDIYPPLDDKTHGQAINDAYPIPIRRLLKVCTKSNELIAACTRQFDQCASQNRQENEERFSAARKIKIECHQELSECVRDATRIEDSVQCLEARKVAIGLFRQKELKTEHKWYEDTWAFVKNYKETFDHFMKKRVDEIKKGAKEAYKDVKEAYEDVEEAISSAVDSVKNWFGSLW